MDHVGGNSLAVVLNGRFQPVCAHHAVENARLDLPWHLATALCNSPRARNDGPSEVFQHYSAGPWPRQRIVGAAMRSAGTRSRSSAAARPLSDRRFAEFVQGTLGFSTRDGHRVQYLYLAVTFGGFGGAPLPNMTGFSSSACVPAEPLASRRQVTVPLCWMQSRLEPSLGAVSRQMMPLRRTCVS